MKFDSEFTCILSCTIKTFGIEENLRPTSVDHFGEVLNYINAAFEEKVRTECNFPTDNTNTGEKGDNRGRLVSLLAISRSIYNRLQEEGFQMRTLLQLQSVLHGTTVDQNLNDD